TWRPCRRPPCCPRLAGSPRRIAGPGRRSTWRRVCGQACRDCPRERARRGRVPASAAIAPPSRRSSTPPPLRGSAQSGSCVLLSNLSVDAQQIRDRLRRPSPEAALGGDSEVARVLLRGRDPALRSLGAVRIV